jgi:hypothetical protein
MTMPNEQPFNVARDGSQVGVQAQHAHIDTVTVHGHDVQLTVGQDDSPEAKYQAGVHYLESRNPAIARKLIREAMMGPRMSCEILFHWLVAMLSDRTVHQFSKDEIGQLQYFRSRWAEVEGDGWADGVRLIYRLLDSVLPSTPAGAGPKTAKTDMSLLVEQFKDLGEEQQEMVRPHLELFLTGPLKDEMWQLELDGAKSGQKEGDRLGRAWMFFHPDPAEVVLPQPPPERPAAVDRLAMWACTSLFALAAGYIGWELLRHGAVPELLGYLVGLAGGIVAAMARLELRFLAERRRLKDERFRVPDSSAPRPSGDELADRVIALFKRYFTRYAPDKAERARWEAAVIGIRRFHTDEIIEICRGSGVSAKDVAWLIRYQVRQLNRRWQDGTLYKYREVPVLRPGTKTACWTGLAASALGITCAVIALWSHPLADLAITVALPSAAWACSRWLRIRLERRRYTADHQERDERQADINEEFRRWRDRLTSRPRDAEMAAWLECGRTVLLGSALDHFQLPRSRLLTHAFLEEPRVAARRARVEGGPLRYDGYRLLVFLLAEDGVRQVRASLDMLTGILTVRERTSFRYDAIVSVHVLREARRGQTFELRLAAGEPITVRVRDADPGEHQQDKDDEPVDDTEEAEEIDPALDAASVANTMLVLEGVAAEGPNWLQGRDWAGT